MTTEDWLRGRSVTWHRKEDPTGREGRRARRLMGSECRRGVGGVEVGQGRNTRGPGDDPGSSDPGRWTVWRGVYFQPKPASAGGEGFKL